MTRDEIPDVRVKMQTLRANRAEKRRRLWANVALWALFVVLGMVVVSLNKGTAIP